MLLLYTLMNIYVNLIYASLLYTGNNVPIFITSI